MKKLLGIVVLGLLLSMNSVKAYPFVKLEDYLTTNSTEDPSISIYTFNRCALLYSLDINFPPRLSANFLTSDISSLLVTIKD